jgi:endonuclease G, mitochondrial
MSKCNVFIAILFPVLFLISPGFRPYSTPESVGLVHSHDSLESFYKNFMPKDSTGCLVCHKGMVICYDEKHEQARWVAYRLTAEMCNNNGEERSNNFRTDPDVKTGSASPDDYKKSGYDRGHLCPAGDMGWDEQTMSESFYMSNMSPQVPAFNRGIWKTLETDVRAWAKQNKEIFIVTAGILTDSLPSIGTNRVSVPSYYYKVILDVHAPEFKAIAFVMPNQGSKVPVWKYAVSIDSVEHLTGIDFFPALPDYLEKDLESQIDISLWNINN